MLKNLSYRMSRHEIDEKLKETKGSWVDPCWVQNKTHANVLLIFHPDNEERVFCRVDTTYDKENALNALNEIVEDLKFTYN